MTEEYRPVPGFETHYQVSNLGNVRSIDRTITDTRGVLRSMRGKQLSAASHADGYRYVNLRIGSDVQNVVNIRQLVAAAFLGHPLHDRSKVIVNRNDDRADDRAENLTLVDGRSFRAELVARARESITAREVCGRGHKMVEENIYEPGRRCRACHLGRSYVYRKGLTRADIAPASDKAYAKLLGIEGVAA